MPRGSEKSPEELRREASQIEHEEKGEKDPSRVAGGKRAAATRKERYGSAAPGTARTKHGRHSGS